MRRFILLLSLSTPLMAHAIQVCDLDGQYVNTANGNTTAGKTGLIRCRDGEAGPVVREQELRNGVFMGAVRYFKGGVLEREYSVNERGNRDGRSREFAATPGPNNALLREETQRNGTTIGLLRTWHPNGQLQRAAFHGDDGREQAVAEFNAQGQLSDLRCARSALLAPAADDAAWCGHRGAATAVPVYGPQGQLRARRTYERGELRRSESLGDDGQVRELIESNAQGGVERSFGPNGTKRREQQWQTVSGNEGGKRRITILDQEHHENGTLVRERRWTPGERGGELQSEKRWYLNGQLRETSEYQTQAGRQVRRDSLFHDNGRPSFEGSWLLAGRYDRAATGVHRSFDDMGRVRLERHHDDRGRVTRERELDEAGGVTRDDELFEDGSRKSFSRP